MGEGWGDASDLPSASASETEAKPTPARTAATLLVIAMFPELPFRCIPSAFTLLGSPYLESRSPSKLGLFWPLFLLLPLLKPLGQFVQHFNLEMRPHLVRLNAPCCVAKIAFLPHKAQRANLGLEGVEECWKTTGSIRTNQASFSDLNCEQIGPRAQKVERSKKKWPSYDKIG